MYTFVFFFFFQAEDGIRDHCVTGVQTCALPILNSGALLDRMNAAVALASGKLPGVTVVLDSIVSAGDAEQLIGVVNEKILGGTMSENTKQVLRRELAGVGDPAQARALAVGLAIGGPEFQRQ